LFDLDDEMFPTEKVPELDMQLVQFRQEEDVMIIPDGRTEWAFAR
jgi:hypothetical protein